MSSSKHSALDPACSTREPRGPNKRPILDRNMKQEEFPASEQSSAPVQVKLEQPDLSRQDAIGARDLQGAIGDRSKEMSADSFQRTIAQLRCISIQAQKMEHERKEHANNARLHEQRALRGEQALALMQRDLVALQRGIDLKRHQIEQDRTKSREEHEASESLGRQIEFHRWNGDMMMQAVGGDISAEGSADANVGRHRMGAPTPW